MDVFALVEGEGGAGEGEGGEGGQGEGGEGAEEEGRGGEGEEAPRIRPVSPSSPSHQEPSGAHLPPHAFSRLGFFLYHLTMRLYLCLVERQRDCRTRGVGAGQCGFARGQAGDLEG
jgi:hypothetical protein